jgi:hypothetical protein
MATAKRECDKEFHEWTALRKERSSSRRFVALTLVFLGILILINCAAGIPKLRVGETQIEQFPKSMGKYGYDKLGKGVYAEVEYGNPVHFISKDKKRQVLLFPFLYRLLAKDAEWPFYCGCKIFFFDENGILISVPGEKEESCIVGKLVSAGYRLGGIKNKEDVLKEFGTPDIVFSAAVRKESDTLCLDETFFYFNPDEDQGCFLCLDCAKKPGSYEGRVPGILAFSLDISQRSSEDITEGRLSYDVFWQRY